MKKEMTEQIRLQTKMEKEIIDQKQEMAEHRQVINKFDEQKKEFAEQKQLQGEMKKDIFEQKQEMKKEMAEQKQLQSKMEKDITDQKQEMKKELTELRGQIQQVHTTTQHIELFTGGPCELCEVFTFDQYTYSQRKGSGKESCSDPFYSHLNGYKFKLRIRYYGVRDNDIGAFLYLLTGEYDGQLPWPVDVTVRLELLNQAGDHHHVERTKTWKWRKNRTGGCADVDDSLMKYSDLEKRGDGVQYMMNNCLKFRLHLTVQAA